MITAVYVLVSRAAGGAGLSLEEANDCGRFHVEGRGVAQDDVASTLRATGAGVLDGDHALIDLAVVRRLAAGRVTAGWDERFEQMVAYAARNGWVAPDGRIQAHIELT
jgi:hypothetical protein